MRGSAMADISSLAFCGNQMDQETNNITQADTALSALGVELSQTENESAKALVAPFSQESEITFMNVTEQLQESVGKLQLQDKIRMSGAAEKGLNGC